MTTLRFVLPALVILVSACGPSAVQVQVPVELKPAPTPTPACNPKSVSDFLSKSDKTLREFDDANKLADQTPRMELAAQIASLQKIHQEYDGIDAPDCAKNYQQFISSAMGNYIHGFLGFLGSADYSPQADFHAADANLNQAAAELVNVQATASGLPTSTPTLVPTATLTPEPHVVLCNGLTKVYQDFGKDITQASTAAARESAKINQNAVKANMVYNKCPTPSASPAP